jgi:pimeloyl-ACP methyl ester carboxylesterase
LIFQRQTGWSLGVDSGYLLDLLRTWAQDYDWRLVEARIRSLPWAVAGHPNTPLRVVHQRAAVRDAAAVVLLHGWPDSVMRFDKVLPLLTDVHVVVPALPGYPFAAPTATSGMSAAAMAEAVAAAMVDLGYHAVRRGG